MNTPKQINWMDIIGKTVTGVFVKEDDAVVVAFGDEFVVIEAWCEYDAGGFRLNFLCKGRDADRYLAEAGLLTEEDIEWREQERRKAREEKRLEEARKAEAKKLEKERREFERLKAKFEGQEKPSKGDAGEAHDLAMLGRKEP